MAKGYYSRRTRVQPTRRPATRADQVQNRTLTRIQNINLLESNPNGGVRQFGQQSILLSDFQGSESIQAMYEQYRFTNVTMFMRPSLKGVANNSRLSALSHAAANYTTGQYFVDYDTTAHPTSQEVEGRSDLKTLALPGGKWTKVASFRPKLLINGGSHQFADNTYWISTQFPSAYNIGLRYQLENGCNGFTPSTGSRMQVQVLIRARLACKGLKTVYGLTALAAPPHTNPPDTLAPESDNSVVSTVPVTYDLNFTMDELRTRLLTGEYFPIDSLGISFGNIGSSVTALDVVGMKFRHNNIIYEIVLGDNGVGYANVV